MKRVVLGLAAAMAAGAALFATPQPASAQVVSFGIGTGGYYGGYGLGNPYYRNPVGYYEGYAYRPYRPFRRVVGYPYSYGYYAPVVAAPVYYYRPRRVVRRVVYNRPIYYAPRRIVRTRVIYSSPAYAPRRVVRTRAVYSRPVYRNDRIVRRVYY
jgi:hypothetical protein